MSVQPENTEELLLYNNVMLKVMLKNQAAILQYLDEIFSHLEAEYNAQNNSSINSKTQAMNKLRKELAGLNFEQFMVQVDKLYLTELKENVHG